MGTKATVTRLIGHPAVERTALVAAGGRLRIVAYHDVTDSGTLRRHLEHISAHYQPVSGEQVARALEARHRLPRRAVWITFDDGFPSVFAGGGALLNSFRISATAYVNPGLIQNDESYWWETVRQANVLEIPIMIGGVEVPPSSAEALLKRCPDRVRRRTIALLRAHLDRRKASPATRQQAQVADLRQWLADGHEIGNHTWDHPCLDRCEPDEQRRQISQAHDWLTEQLDSPVSSFAYPNGNWVRPAEQELRRLGYRTAVGFDHRMCRGRPAALRLSRLRLDADASLPRMRAVLSGLHPALLSLRASLRSDRRNDPRRLPR